jgi:hypothetical protein
MLAEWPADKICPMVSPDEGLRAALLARCRSPKIEPPGRMDPDRGSGPGAVRARVCLHPLNGVSADAERSLWELATGEDGFLPELKSDPGRLGQETLLEEIVKPKALGLPADLLGGYSDRLVAEAGGSNGTRQANRSGPFPDAPRDVHARAWSPRPGQSIRWSNIQLRDPIPPLAALRRKYGVRSRTTVGPGRSSPPHDVQVTGLRCVRVDDLPGPRVDAIGADHDVRVEPRCLRPSDEGEGDRADWERWIRSARFGADGSGVSR